MRPTDKKEYLLRKRELTNNEYKMAHSESYTALSFFSQAWFWSMIIAFIGLALIASNISYSIGAFLFYLFGLVSVTCLSLAILTSHLLDKAQKKYSDEIISIESERLESFSSKDETQGADKQ